MQYLLTEQEYKDLLNKVIIAKENSKETINDLCQQVANLKLYGCIRNNGNDRAFYCDDCPVIKICLYDGKEYSK